MVDAKGMVVGVNTWRPDQTASGRPIENIGFAIASNSVKEWLPKLMAGIDADSIAFKVLARKSYEVPIEVEAGAEVFYAFKSDLDINFAVYDPSGDVVASNERVFDTEGKFVASGAGRYRFVFDNSFSVPVSKTVRLDYQVIQPG